MASKNEEMIEVLRAEALGVVEELAALRDSMSAQSWATVLVRRARKKIKYGALLLEGASETLAADRRSRAQMEQGAQNAPVSPSTPGSRDSHSVAEAERWQS